MIRRKLNTYLYCSTTYYVSVKIYKNVTFSGFILFDPWYLESYQKTGQKSCEIKEKL